MMSVNEYAIDVNLSVEKQFTKENKNGGKCFWKCSLFSKEKNLLNNFHIN